MSTDDLYPSSSKEYNRSSHSEEDSQPFLYKSTNTQRTRTQRSDRRVRLLVYASVGLIYTTLWICVAWFGAEHIISYKGAISKLQRYSPILKEVDMNMHTQTFNGSLFKLNAYRQDGGPEVDAAWEALGVDYRPLSIPESEAARSGLAPDQVRINKKYGGGYPANVEGLHHLHCLNLLRKSLWYNYDHYHALKKGPFSNEDYVIKAHVTHCLDILRQQLMCTVDVGVLGQVWWNRDSPHAFVDFNTQHTCRNYDDIREWARIRQLPAEVPEDYLEPPIEGGRIYAEIP